MSDEELLNLSMKFLDKIEVSYVKPGRVGNRAPGFAEVIFLVPEALNPDVVIDPPDVRLKVDLKNKNVTLIEQM